MAQKASNVQLGPLSGADAWGLRHAGLSPSDSGKNQMKDFTGMWRLEPGADLGRTQDFDRYTFLLSSQFDGSEEKYFDDLVFNGKDNLAAVWGACVGCRSGLNVTARDIEV